MKKSGLIMLLVLLLSFSVVVTAEDFNEFSISQENIPIEKEIQITDSLDFGGVVVFSARPIEQENLVFIINALNSYTVLTDKAEINLLYQLDLKALQDVIVITAVRGGNLLLASCSKLSLL